MKSLAKRILMVLEEPFPPDNRVENEIKILNEIGFEIHIVCLRKKGQNPKEVYNQNNLIFRIDMPNWIYKSSIAFFQIPVYYLYWHFKITSFIRNNDYHIVHIHDLRLAKLGLHLKEKFNLKFVLDLHENYPDMLKESEHIKKRVPRLFFNYEKWLKYEKKMVYSADMIITVVDEMKFRIAKKIENKEKICVYQNVPDLQRFENLKKQEISNFHLEKNKINLLYVGAINKPRGLDTIAEALSISDLLKEKLRVIVVGNGSYKGEFRNYINRLGLIESFIFFEHQKMNQVLKFMEMSDIGIIPHFRSPQNDCSSPNKLFQYMFSKLPVIVSNCSSLERIVLENECGYVFQEKNAEDLASKLEEMIKSLDLSKIKGCNGNLAVVREFNTFHEGEKLKNAYFRAIN